MKKNILTASVFMLAIGAAYVFAPIKAKGNRSLATRTVYYNTGTQTNCPNSALCSNINNNDALCIDGVSTYFEVPSTCTTVSDYKWRP